VLQPELRDPPFRHALSARWLSPDRRQLRWRLSDCVLQLHVRRERMPVSRAGAGYGVKPISAGNTDRRVASPRLIHGERHDAWDAALAGAHHEEGPGWLQAPLPHPPGMVAGNGYSP
jgi:hypothetical protein